jgi:hypothetical protein
VFNRGKTEEAYTTGECVKCSVGQAGKGGGVGGGIRHRHVGKASTRQ